jgi:S-adenosylmethionine hydrolase
MPIITLTTDFGSRDGYVGAVKGVISRLAPGATLIDIAHDIPRGDIAHAAFVVATSTTEFPHGTIHLVVVDPGVGGERPSVIARVPVAPRGSHIYVGPDNGVFAYLVADKAWTIHTAELGQISPTFHGRDVFAPVAAAIAKQHTDLYGAPTTLTGKLPWGGGGHIVHIDHFGNLISDVRGDAGATAVSIAGHRVPIVRTYEDVAPGAVLAYVGSSGTLEVAVRDGRADTQLGIARGATITIDHEGPYR